MRNKSNTNILASRGAQIQTNPKNNRKLIQKNQKLQKSEYFWMSFCETAGSDRIIFWIDFSKPIQTEPNRIHIF
jgi:type IV secretory pathway TrbL component